MGKVSVEEMLGKLDYLNQKNLERKYGTDAEKEQGLCESLSMLANLDEWMSERFETDPIPHLTKWMPHPYWSPAKKSYVGYTEWAEMISIYLNGRWGNGLRNLRNMADDGYCGTLPRMFQLTVPQVQFVLGETLWRNMDKYVWFSDSCVSRIRRWNKKRGVTPDRTVPQSFKVKFKYRNDSIEQLPHLEMDEHILEFSPWTMHVPESYELTKPGYSALATSGLINIWADERRPTTMAEAWGYLFNRRIPEGSWSKLDDEYQETLWTDYSQNLWRYFVSGLLCASKHCHLGENQFDESLRTTNTKHIARAILNGHNDWFALHDALAEETDDVRYLSHCRSGMFHYPQSCWLLSALTMED